MKSTQASLRRLTVLPACCIIATFVSSSLLLGDDFVRAIPGDFSTMDWSEYGPPGTRCGDNLCPPPEGPPGAGDNASLNGRDVTASGGSVMNLTGGGSLTLSGGFNAKSASGFTLKGSGTLTANSSSGININGGRLATQTDIGKFINISNGGSEVAASL